jgi:hypothetical protein
MKTTLFLSLLLILTFSQQPTSANIVTLLPPVVFNPLPGPNQNAPVVSSAHNIVQVAPAQPAQPKESAQPAHNGKGKAEPISEYIKINSN